MNLMNDRIASTLLHVLNRTYPEGWRENFHCLPHFSDTILSLVKNPEQRLKAMKALEQRGFIARYGYGKGVQTLTPKPYEWVTLTHSGYLEAMRVIERVTLSEEPA